MEEKDAKEVDRVEIWTSGPCDLHWRHPEDLKAGGFEGRLDDDRV